MGANGVLFLGALELSAVYAWNSSLETLTRENQKLVVGNTSTMQWPDTFAFDDAGNLYFVSNRLHLYINVAPVRPP